MAQFCGVVEPRIESAHSVEILKDFNCKVNIIPYNNISKEYKRPEIEKINNFVAALDRTNSNFKTFIRWSKGIDINAACGQLATENEL